MGAEKPPPATCRYFSTIVGLSYRASLKTADAIMVYAERLFEAAKGDMAVLLVIVAVLAPPVVAREDDDGHPPIERR